MNRKWTYSVAALALLLALFGTGCQFYTKLQARDHLNKGVQAFRNARYSDAVDHFKNAIQLDPSFSSARLYLAVAYFQQWVPGTVGNPDNDKNLQLAREEFNDVLSREPDNNIALEYMAQLNYSETQSIADLDAKIKKLDEARDWYEKLASHDSKSKNAFYMMGVITWTKCFSTLSIARVRASMRPEDPPPLKDKKAREELRAKYWDMINGGVQNLTHALDIDAKYDDAMAYLNLLYRERADLEATPEEAKADLNQADAWMQKTLEIRKTKAGMAAEGAAAGGQQ
jgi:tetratricopeptide (TPR) repeat protein